MVVASVLAGLAVLGTSTGGWRAGVTAAAEPAEESEFIDAINEIRFELDLPALEHDPELTQLARDHAEEMAAAGEIYHADPISAGLTADWAKLGENVGVGASVDVLVDAFVASPGHYANIIDPGFTRIGVGVVWKGSAMYTTHRFLQPPAADGVSDGAVTHGEVAGDERTGGLDHISGERVARLVGLLDDPG